MLELLLTMTLTGTAVSLLWLAACRLLGARLSAPWRYRGLRLSPVFWLVPVERCLTVLGGLLRMETGVNVPTVLPKTFTGPRSRRSRCPLPRRSGPFLRELPRCGWRLGAWERPSC